MVLFGEVKFYFECLFDYFLIGVLDVVVVVWVICDLICDEGEDINDVVLVYIFEMMLGYFYFL